MRTDRYSLSSESFINIVDQLLISGETVPMQPSELSYEAGCFLATADMERGFVLGWWTAKSQAYQRRSEGSLHLPASGSSSEVAQEQAALIDTAASLVLSAQAAGSVGAAQWAVAS